ncbi:MAG: hypothetical protein EZS28_027574 [Streblomastix strix]|uniref:Uncharacterized protein n=1 Tax=Streblomastix strix TaxID=222440 RepID=A0A5J4V2D5_9EUKA|nr:MAG: hypothetical protein EZS28_027574 [Streblomastix strix]
MTMIADAASSGWSFALVKESKIIAMAQKSWNKTIRGDTSTAISDIKKQKVAPTLIKKIKQVYQTIEKLGIQILITRLPGVKNEIADALSRLSTVGDYKVKEKFFQQTCFKMNLNPTIDLLSQHFNNLQPRFMQTIKGYGEITIDALNQVWKMEIPWIYPPIPLFPTVLKKIREEQIRAMIIAPQWQSQIWYKELVNENDQSFILGWSREILEPGTQLIKKNLKLLSGKICCFLVDRRPENDEYMQERF